MLSKEKKCKQRAVLHVLKYPSHSLIKKHLGQPSTEEVHLDIINFEQGLFVGSALLGQNIIVFTEGEMAL
jgi:hypothetical protein